MKILKISVLLFVVLIITSFFRIIFSKKNLDFYKETTPKMDIKDYFNGSIRAWGIIQDWRGEVIQRFDVKMHGEWKGDLGILIETFNYYDGKKKERIWTIKKKDDGQYEGTADDILGKALGKIKGSAAQWSYVMDLAVDGKTYRIHFDDWMWLLNDGVLVNRSYLKKWGITVAELTIFMKKE